MVHLERRRERRRLSTVRRHRGSALLAYTNNTEETRPKLRTMPDENTAADARIWLHRVQALPSLQTLAATLTRARRRHEDSLVVLLPPHSGL